MFHKEQSRSWYWLRLLGVVTLLAFGLWLLGSQAAAAQDGPTPYRPAFERPPITAPRGPAVESGSRAAQTLDRGPVSLLGQPQVNPGFTLDLTYDALWGLVGPGDLVTATRTSDGAYAAGEADGVGFFWSYFWLDNGQPADIAGWRHRRGVRQRRAGRHAEPAGHQRRRGCAGRRRERQRGRPGGRNGCNRHVGRVRLDAHRRAASGHYSGRPGRFHRRLYRHR